MPLEAEEKVSTFKCNHCCKMCKTAAALSVHTKCVHGVDDSSSSSLTGIITPIIPFDPNPRGSDVIITNHSIDHLYVECRDILDDIASKVEGRVAKAQGAKRIAGNKRYSYTAVFKADAIHDFIEEFTQAELASKYG